MTEAKNYTVLRSMHGDGRDYNRGDTRQMTATDAAVLVKNGALALEGEEAAERKPAVQHTFGSRPSRVNRRGYTSPSGGGIIVPNAGTGASPSTPAAPAAPATSLAPSAPAPAEPPAPPAPPPAALLPPPAPPEGSAQG